MCKMKKSDLFRGRNQWHDNASSTPIHRVRIDDQYVKSLSNTLHARNALLPFFILIMHPHRLLPPQPPPQFPHQPPQPPPHLPPHPRQHLPAKRHTLQPPLPAPHRAAHPPRDPPHHPLHPIHLAQHPPHALSLAFLIRNTLPCIRAVAGSEVLDGLRVRLYKLDDDERDQR